MEEQVVLDDVDIVVDVGGSETILQLRPSEGGYRLGAETTKEWYDFVVQFFREYSPTGDPKQLFWWPGLGLEEALNKALAVLGGAHRSTIFWFTMPDGSVFCITSEGPHNLDIAHYDGDFFAGELEYFERARETGKVVSIAMRKGSVSVVDVELTPEAAQESRLALVKQLAALALTA